MKNPYRRGRVLPSPLPPTCDHYLSLLPATILTLTVALSPEDKQVLAYLISCYRNGSAAGAGKGAVTRDSVSKPSYGSCRDHTPLFGCDCFRCYMSYWVRWDASPNRQVIHDLIEAYEEDQMLAQRTRRRKKKEVKKKGGYGKPAEEFVGRRFESGRLDESPIMDSCEIHELSLASPPSPSRSVIEDARDDDVKQQSSELDNRGSVRKMVGLIGEKIWGFWSVDY